VNDSSIAASSAITHARLHATIARHFLDHGHAPSLDTLSRAFGAPREVVVRALHALQAYHGVVLHPKSGEIWALHPFSAAPTSFWVRSARGQWWGNCAWCSLGIAALLKEDVTITTTLGGESEQIVLRIADGRVTPEHLLVHFPVPMERAWDNVVYTCSVMLLFASNSAIDDWCERHRIQKGDVQPVSRVWDFARAWYERHLDPDWAKWTTAEATALFTRFGLTGPIWTIQESSDRF
jgi:hypothetical protein